MMNEYTHYGDHHNDEIMARLIDIDEYYMKINSCLLLVCHQEQITS